MNEGGKRAYAVEAEGLTRTFSAGSASLEILRGVEVSVSAGEIIAIVGPSGSGKSTLLHCLGGLDRPTSGTVRVDGEDLSTLGEIELARLRNEKVGFVFQFHHLLPDFSALENVMLPLLIAGQSKEKARVRSERLLDEVGLAARSTHAPSELSGGEQQRVAVARALANEPSVVLADEPSGNLDVAHSAELHDLLCELRDRRGTTFVVATHEPELASRADRVLALRGGRLVEVDPADPSTWILRSRIEVGS
jgi:lipoprotein-releasing system ATP-binding protein